MENTVGTDYVLVLDFDGVITRLDIDWRSLREELSEYLGVKIASINKLFEETYGTPTFWLAHEFVERRELLAVETSVLNEEVANLIISFPGIKYVATLQSERAVVKFLEKHGLLLFKEILGRPRFASKEQELRYILNTIEPEKIIFIDDSRQNIEICNKLEIRYCIHMKNNLDINNILRNK